MSSNSRPSIRTYYLLEPDAMRKHGEDKPAAFALRDKLRRAVHSATGSVTFSRDRTTVFHRSAESRSVRHTVNVHSAYEWQSNNAHHTGQFFEEVMKSAIDSAFVDHRDVITFSIGNSSSLKSTLLHGKTLEIGGRVRNLLDQTADWGLLQRSADYLLKRLDDPAERDSFSLSASCSVVQLDHASDIIVPAPVKDRYNTTPTREDVEKEQNRLIRLVSLARASSLDVVTKCDDQAVVAAAVNSSSCSSSAAASAAAAAAGGGGGGGEHDALLSAKAVERLLNHPSTATTAAMSKMRLEAVDQSEIPIRELSDVQHVVNCLTAVDTHREAHLVSSVQSAPFYVITTLILRPNSTNSDCKAPFRIRFVECADFDWTANDHEDTEHSQRISASLTSTLCALTVWQREIAWMRINESMTCRAIFADIRLPTVTSLVFGTATYRSALPTMDFLARVRDTALWVALHGADGEEDEAVVDEELKQHMTYVQQQCDELRRQVVRMNASKELLAKQVDEEDQNIQKLQEQLSLLRRLTAENVRTREELIEIHDEKQEREAQALARAEQEKQAELESKLRTSRVGALERELDTLRQEDALKDTALEAQIQSISAETRRLISNAATLEEEASELQKKIDDQDNKYEEIQKAHEAQKIQKMNELMDARWAELEAQSRERISAVQTAEVNARKRQQMAVLQNKAYTEAIHRPLSDPDVAALKAAKQKIKELEAESSELETSRKSTIHQLKRDAARAQHEVSEAEAEIRILGKYLHDITRILWRFENTTGYVMDNLSQLPKLGVPVFDPLAPISANQLRELSRKCRLWLQDNAGEQPPAVAFDVENARAEVLDVGFLEWIENITRRAISQKEVF